MKIDPSTAALKERIRELEDKITMYEGNLLPFLKAERDAAQAEIAELKEWHGPYESRLIAERDDAQARAEKAGQALIVLAEFARTAPGRLPQRVQDALAVAENGQVK